MRSIHSNDVTQMTTANPTVASTISQRYGQPREKLQGDRDAAQLARERHQVHDLRRDERAEAALNPTRSRTASKTALPETAATRPHISE